MLRIGFFLLEARESEQHQAAEHRGEPEEADLAVAELQDPLERLAPELRREKWQQPLDDQHEAECHEQRASHHLAVPRPGFLKYLKKSELGSSTRMSERLRKLARYASRLR